MPLDIRKMCTEWEQDHGKINDDNFLRCFFDILKVLEHRPENIETAMRTIIEMGDIQHCACCGRVPAHEKDINGELIKLCSDCQCLVLYQQLGPGEGYV